MSRRRAATEILTITHRAIDCDALRFPATGSTRKHTCCLITCLLRQQFCWFSFIKYFFNEWKLLTQLLWVAARRKSAHTARFTATATRRDSTCSSQLQWVADRRRQSQRVARVSHTKRFSATGQLQTIASLRLVWARLNNEKKVASILLNRLLQARSSRLVCSPVS